MTQVAAPKASRTPGGVSPGREAGHILPLLLAYALASLLAFVRDASIAAVFGSSAQTDAYFVGTFIPTLLSTVMVTTSLVPAFLPYFTSYLGDRTAAMRVVSATVTSTILALGLVSLVVFIAAELVVGLIGHSWDHAQLETAAFLLRVSVPTTLALGLSALLAAVGNAYDRYITPPLGLAASHITVTLVTFLLASRLGIMAPAFGLLLGSAVQLVIQVLAVWRAGVRLVPTIAVPEGALRGVGVALAPMLLYSSLVQSVPLLERWLASGLPAGQLSYLAYATKLAMIPMAVVSTPSVLVFFVAMSRDGASGDLLALRSRRDCAC